MTDNIALTIAHGEDKTFTFPIVQADGVTEQDCTGWHVRFFVKTSPDSPYEKDVSFSTPTNGIGNVPVTRAESLAFIGGKTYDVNVWRMDTSSAVLLGRGSIVVSKSVRLDSE